MNSFFADKIFVQPTALHNSQLSISQYICANSGNEYLEFKSVTQKKYKMFQHIKGLISTHKFKERVNCMQSKK